MKYWQRFSPREAADGVGDLLSYWRQPTPYRWQILGVAVAMTFTLMVLLIPESERAQPARPTVTYITTFDPARTEEQIVASNVENQKRKEAREAELARRAERKKEGYRALGRALGMDVEAMEAEAKREQAAEEAAAAARRPPQPAAQPATQPAQAPVER